MDAKVQIEYGNLHPLDESEGESKDWKHSAARGVVAMLQDIPEVNAAMEAMDGARRSEFVAAIADIINEASMMEDETSEDVAVAEEVAAE